MKNKKNNSICSNKDSSFAYRSCESVVKTQKVGRQDLNYSYNDAIEEFEELKRIALNCYDKNGNPNISAALRAVENKAKIANLYSGNNLEIGAVVRMGEITIDGQQLKLNIGEDFNYK